jgi:hypothetical protein
MSSALKIGSREGSVTIPETAYVRGAFSLGEPDVCVSADRGVSATIAHTAKKQISREYTPPLIVSPEDESVAMPCKLHSRCYQYHLMSSETRRKTAERCLF